jgi:predicted ribosome quality control (RQC) complex YloA/Tae2 family protein
LLAHAHLLEHGQSTSNYDGLEIALDPKLTPVENAQRYFRDYRRARDAARVVPGLIKRTEHELAYLAEVVNQLDLATDQTALEQLRRELVAAGLASPNRADAKRARAPKPHGGFRRLQVGDFSVLVGTTALGNEHVTFDLGAPDDVWLHAHGIPGSHVVIRTAGRPIPLEVLREAARLAAVHSAARDQVSVAVDWTLRKYVRKIRGAGPGLVTYAHEQALTIRPGGADSAANNPAPAG